MDAYGASRSIHVTGTGILFNERRCDNQEAHVMTIMSIDTFALVQEGAAK